MSVNHGLCDPHQVISTLRALVSIPGKLSIGREQQLSNLFFLKSIIDLSLEIFCESTIYKIDFKNGAALVEERRVETSFACL